MASVRPVREPPSQTPEPEDRERKERIRAQLLAGERIATRDIQPGEYFVQLHRALLRALNTAHRLTAAQRQYLGVLMEYSYGYRSPWAIRDMADRRPPSLGDWCNWLGGWSSEQVCGVRKQLLDLRVIRYAEQNSMYVALNETWEEWDQELFSRHEKRAGAGRPAQINSQINAKKGGASLIHELTGMNSRINGVNSRINGHEFTNSPVLIHELTGDGHEATPQEGVALALNKRRNEELTNTKRRETHSHLQEPSKQKTKKKTADISPALEKHSYPMSSPGTTKTDDFVSQPAKDHQKPPQTHQLNSTSQAVLFPAIPMPVPPQPADVGQQKSSPSRRGSHSNTKRKQPPQNELYAVWKQILPSATERQVKSTIIGLAELANPEKTMGNPVMPGELPALMYQVMDWRDRDTREHYTPTPRLLAEWLDKIRRQVQNTPAPQVQAWMHWQMQQAEVAPGAADDLAHLIEIVLAFEAYLREDPFADPSAAPDAGEESPVASSTEAPDSEQPGEATPGEEALDDFSWAARLRQFVPDADGARNGRPERDVGMLWGFVRDALRPGLNTARRQHLDALTPAWDPEQPGELLLLSTSGYTVHFIESTLLREIDERVDKFLSRFFDRAKVLTVPQWVIEALLGHVQPEEELATIAR